jgi:hypothetical protein
MYIRADNSAPTGNGTVTSYRPNIKITITTASGAPSINESMIETSSFAVSAFPNPTKGVVTIESNGDIKSIEVFNIAGARMYSNANLGNSTSNEVDLSDFQNGVYIIIVNDGVKKHTMKVIKQ